MLLLLSIMSEEHVLTRSDLRCTDPAESTRVRRRRDGDGHHRAAVEPAAPAPVRAQRPLVPAARHVLHRRRRHGDGERRGARAEMGQLRLPEHVLEWYLLFFRYHFINLISSSMIDARVSDGWSNNRTCARRCRDVERGGEPDAVQAGERRRRRRPGGALLLGGQQDRVLISRGMTRRRCS